MICHFGIRTVWSALCNCFCHLGRTEAAAVFAVGKAIIQHFRNCRVKEFGPLIVSIDTKGNNLFEKNKIEFNKRKDEQIEKISKQVGFIK